MPRWYAEDRRGEPGGSVRRAVVDRRGEPDGLVTMGRAGYMDTDAATVRAPVDGWAVRRD